MDDILSKKEIRRQVGMFLADKKRTISGRLFAEMAGMNYLYLRQIVREDLNFSERIQRRLDKALREYREGKYVVFANRKRERTIEYRREPKPTAHRYYGIGFQNNQFKLQLGLRQSGDYSAPTLSEQMNRGQK